MADFELATQIASSSRPNIVRFPYEDDAKFNPGDFPDAVVYRDDTPMTFRLAPEFCDHLSVQSLENYSPVTLLNATAEEQNFLENCENEEERDAAFRRIVRRTFPLRILLKKGILYSPSCHLILKGVGLVDFILQEELTPGKIFKNAFEHTKFVRDQRTAKEKSQFMYDSEMEEQPLPQVSTFSSPLPSPRKRAASTSIFSQAKRIKLEDETEGKTLSFPFYSYSQLKASAFCNRTPIDPYADMPQSALNKFPYSTCKNLFEKSFEKDYFQGLAVGYSFWKPSEDSNDIFPFVNVFKTTNTLKGLCLNLSFKEAQNLMLLLGKTLNKAMLAMNVKLLENTKEECMALSLKGMEEQAAVKMAAAVECFHSAEKEIEKRARFLIPSIQLV